MGSEIILLPYFMWDCHLMLTENEAREVLMKCRNIHIIHHFNDNFFVEIVYLSGLEIWQEMFKMSLVLPLTPNKIF